MENATYARVNDPRNRAFTRAEGFPHVAWCQIIRPRPPESSSRSFCYLNEKGQAPRARAPRWTSRRVFVHPRGLLIRTTALFTNARVFDHRRHRECSSIACVTPIVSVPSRQAGSNKHGEHIVLRNCDSLGNEHLFAKIIIIRDKIDFCTFHLYLLFSIYILF